MRLDRNLKVKTPDDLISESKCTRDNNSTDNNDVDEKGNDEDPDDDMTTMTTATRALH